MARALGLYFLLLGSASAELLLRGANQVVTEDQEHYNNTLTSTCSYTSTCTVSGTEGVCVSISAGCCNTGTKYSGYCSGSSDIECCINPSCSTPYGTGTCQTTSTCSGTSYSGYCAGPSSMECCVGSAPSPSPPSPSPPTPTSSSLGVDVRTSVCKNMTSCHSIYLSQHVANSSAHTLQKNKDICSLCFSMLTPIHLFLLFFANTGVRVRGHHYGFVFCVKRHQLYHSARLQVHGLRGHLRVHHSEQRQIRRHFHPRRVSET